MILWQFLPLNVTFFSIFSLLSLVNCNSILNDYFILDSFGVYLSIIPVFIVYSLFNNINLYNSVINLLLVYFSCLSGIICFLSCNVILFFVFYELSIILLCFSLFINSPYSERNSAGWYFLGYIVFGGVPLLILCINLSLISSNILFLNISDNINYLLFLIFITKVPLFPFHAWLPIVHAEANSYVSILLSGYIMKLGLLGVFRFFSHEIYILKSYLIIFFLISCVFFISCFCELDNKRWLAFLSLGHISVGMCGLFSLSPYSCNVLGSFSLGHGISVFILFFFFYLSSLLSGSRNWIVSVIYNNNVYNLIIIFGMLSLVAFPPCVLFFNELIIFISVWGSSSLVLIFSIYIFFSIFGPISTLALIVSRLSNHALYYFSSYNTIILLCSCLYFFYIFIILN